MDDKRMSLRTYLIVMTMMDSDADIFLASEAVDSTAIEHPEWDLGEVRTWNEWTEWNKKGRQR
jgi:hypothetical protein